MSHVLVVFQADTERTEQLALAVGVGAVEAEASIRLRRLVTADAVEVGHKGYGTLKEADLLWADAVVAGLEDERPRLEELQGLLSLLGAVEPGALKEKRVWTFGAEGMAAEKTEAQHYVEDALQAAGMTILPAVFPDRRASDRMEQMKEAGRSLTKGRA